MDTARRLIRFQVFVTRNWISGVRFILSPQPEPPVVIPTTEHGCWAMARSVR